MKGKIEEIKMPDAIRKYNEGMLGVDLPDWKVKKYRISIRSKKWYFCAFSRCLDVIMVNAHELYKICTTDESKLDLLEFRCVVTSCLLREGAHNHGSRSFKGVRVPKAARLIGDHIMQRTTGK